MAKRLVQATFSNGEVLVRGSDTRHYTHAYLATGTRPQEVANHFNGNTSWGCSGFSGSEALAKRALATELGYRNDPGYTTILAEVVAVVEICKRCNTTIRPEGGHMCETCGRSI